MTHPALLAAPLLCLITLPATAQEVTLPGLGYSEATGLPYEAPGRGIVDYDALIRRELSVLEHQFGAFRDQSAALAEAARLHCDSDIDSNALTEQLKATWLSWAPLEAYQFGPMEITGAALTINFWPDKRGFVAAGLSQVLSLPAEDQGSADGVAQVSGAGQGLPALAALLTDPALPDCPAAVGISARIAQMGDGLYDAWFDEDGWAEIARSAGPENPVYLAPFEFTKEIYSALDFALINAGEQRLGRPLGDGRPVPSRVNGHRLGIGAEIIDAQLAGIAEMVEDGFAGDVNEPDRAWLIDVVEQAQARVARIGMPLSQAVQDPQASWRVDEAMNKIAYLRAQFAQDLGPELGVDTGFTPADGD